MTWTYGGVVDEDTLRKRIPWAFFIEEHKIVFGILKAQQKKANSGKKVSLKTSYKNRRHTI